MRKVDDGEKKEKKKEKKKKKIMTFIVATTVVASRLPERRLTDARAKSYYQRLIGGNQTSKSKG